MANTPNLDLENVNVLLDNEYVYNQLVSEIITKINNNNSKIDEIPNNMIPIAQKGVANGVATLNNDGLIPKLQLPTDIGGVEKVTNIAERDALVNPYDNKLVFVIDASDDETVASGWAMYMYSVAGSSWLKIVDGESLDINLTWDDISNKPDVFPPETHTHAQIDINKQDISDLQRDKVDKVEGSRLVSETEIEVFNDKYTKLEVDNKISDVTFPLATISNDGLMSKEHVHKVETNKTDILSLKTDVGSVEITTTDKTLKGAINELNSGKLPNTHNVDSNAHEDIRNITSEINNQISTIETQTLIESYLSSRDIPTTAKRGKLDVLLKGMSANQIVKNGNFANGTTGWSSTTAVTVSNNEAVFTATARNQGISQTKNLVNGRKYFISVDVYASSNQVGLELQKNTTPWTTFSSKQHSGVAQYERLMIILEGTADTWDTNIRVRDLGTSAWSQVKVKNAVCIDMGGSTSSLYNKTVEEMNEMFPSYIDGLQGSTNIRVLSTGKNLFDGELELGIYSASTGEKTPLNNFVRCKNFIQVKQNTDYVFSKARFILLYDANKKFIKSYNDNIALDENIPQLFNSLNAHFVTFHITGTNILENIQLEEGTVATEYEKGTENLYKTLDGQPVTLHRLPNGVYDEILRDGKNVKRIRENTLQASDVSLSSDLTNVTLYVITRTDKKRTNNGSSILHSTHQAIDFPTFVDDTSYVGKVYHSDNSDAIRFVFSKGTTLAQAQSSLAGTKMIYELAQPQILDTNATPLIAEPNGHVFISSEGCMPSNELSYPLNLGAVVDGLIEGQKEQSELLGNLNTKVDIHKAETVSQMITATRDMTLTGKQVVTGFNKIPKKITIYASIGNTRKMSIGIISSNQRVTTMIYETGLVASSGDFGVIIAENATNRTLGMVTIVGKTIEIDWTHEGSGATNIVAMRIVADYHGEA